MSYFGTITYIDRNQCMGTSLSSFDYNAALLDSICYSLSSDLDIQETNVATVSTNLGIATTNIATLSTDIASLSANVISLSASVQAILQYLQITV